MAMLQDPYYAPYPPPPASYVYPVPPVDVYDYPPPMMYPPYAPPMGMPIEPVAMPPPPPEPEVDHPDLYIPEPVKSFIPYFQRQISEKNGAEILTIYESEFNKLSDRYFTEYPWPEVDRIVPFLRQDETTEIFEVLYKELYFRHIYAKHKNFRETELSLQHRFDSYHNYCKLFKLIIDADSPLDIELPNQWLWDIIDEFLYQFQSFVQFRGKLKRRTPDEIDALRDNADVWNVHGVLNILYSLVEKSKINALLEASHHGAEPPASVGAFGKHPLYRYLGYYSLIGLLRLHCQLGDHYIALQSVAHVQLSKKALTTTRVPASQITLYYYVGFCYLMLRRYKDTIRTFSNIIVFIQRAKQHFQPKSYQHDLVVKMNEQMLSILSMVLTLCPQHVDEVVNSQLKERFGERMAKLQKGDLKTFEDLFLFSCPKFISPVPPDYESLPDNYDKEPTTFQCNVFIAEIEPQLILPVIRSYLKFYTTMPISKLAAFMEVEDAEALREQLLRFKHKMRSLVSTSKGTNLLGGELQSSSDLDFYINGDMIHIADTKVARRYGDFFIRQINKLEELTGSRKAVTHLADATFVH
ncbi:hypothetical protein EMCRGX_G027562 [Ephydatia muelleri]